MIKRLNLQPENFFLTRAMTVQKFEKIEEWGSATRFSARRSISNSSPASAT